MIVLTGVGAVLSAAHRSKSGSLHGHTWEVVAWFKTGRDALELQSRLNVIIGELGHAILPDELAWGEAIAEHVAKSFDDSLCIAVDVPRPAERIYARWER